MIVSEKQVFVFPSDAYLVTPSIPKLQGGLTSDLVNQRNELINTIEKLISQIQSIKSWKLDHEKSTGGKN